MDFLFLEKTSYDILIGLTIMIQLPAWPDYYRILLKIHYGRDHKILNYENEGHNVNTSEEYFSSDSADEPENQLENSKEELVQMLKEPEKKSESSDEDPLVDEKLSHLN